MSVTRPALALAVLLAAARAAPADPVQEAVASGVPDALAREVAARAAERGVGAAEALGPVVEAARRGVPPRLVAAKVLEGLSKGVPGARVAAVARELGGRLATAADVLAQARRAGLAPPADPEAALLDLAAALRAGVTREALAALVDAAHDARGGSDAVVSAALALAALARQGVPPADAAPLGFAIARTGPRSTGELAGLFETWRAEGGEDARAFVAEASRRIETGRTLDGMVDVFGGSPDRIAVDRGADRGAGRDGLIGSDVGKRGAEQGVGAAERPDAARGAVPGVDEVRGPGRGQGPKKP